MILYRNRYSFTTLIEANNTSSLFYCQEIFLKIIHFFAAVEENKKRLWNKIEISKFSVESRIIKAVYL